MFRMLTGSIWIALSIFSSILVGQDGGERPLSATQSTAVASDNFEKRLATLDALLEEARIKNNIPGFAIAIVKDDEVVFAKGYGVSNVELKTPVTTDTLFAIGSSTKAFTGALIGMLVDEGTMNWDAPVSQFLPGFKLKVDTGGEPIKIRDLLCHRTGYSRMGILWAGGNLSRDEIIKRASQAEPYADFQEKFIYNNVMFMVAGVSAGRAAGHDWDTLIADRIFNPLGMGDSSTTIRVAQSDPRLSLGYVWDVDRKEFTHLPMRTLNSIGPAGSINSNVNDMAQWIRFQLSKGQFNGQTLLSEQQHAETWKKQMNIAGNVDYGFGWMLRDWNGERVVEHGGNIDGFGAQVSLLPKHDTGYVLLTNVTTSPLQQGSINLVFDTLFGETAETNDSAPNGLGGVDTSVLVGDYIANFGPFNNATMRVLLKDGNLALDVPGQRIFELNSPDEEGKWYFSLTDQVAISFNRNDQGKVISISMYQNGAEPEFIRDDVELAPESPESVTAPLVGHYRDNKNKRDFEIVIRKGRLVIDRGRNAFTMLPPDENGLWALRPKPEGFQIRFNQNDDGSITSLTWMNDGDEIEMPRIGQSNAVSLPTTEELFSKIRDGIGSLNDEFVGVRMKGTSTFIHQGASGTVELVFSKTGQHATRREFGKMATIIEAFDGTRGVSDSNIDRYRELLGRKLKLFRLSHPLWFLGDLSQDYPHRSVSGEGEIDGQKTYLISVSSDILPARKLHVAADSGLILQEDTVWISDKVGDIPVTITYSDYRDVGGVQLPFKTTVDNRFTGKLVTQFESAEALSELPEDEFVVPKPKE